MEGFGVHTSMWTMNWDRAGAEKAIAGRFLVAPLLFAGCHRVVKIGVSQTKHSETVCRDISSV